MSGPYPVRYVQLDVEGWDDHLLGALPFGRSSGGGGGGPVFSPDVRWSCFEWNVKIGFERITRAIPMLKGFRHRNVGTIAEYGGASRMIWRASTLRPSVEGRFRGRIAYSVQ